MEDKKFFWLYFEIKEITGGPSSQVSCLVEVGDFKQIVTGRSSIDLMTKEAASASHLSITALHGEKPIGNTKVSLLTLFSESLQGKIDKHFKLRSDNYPNLRVKLAANLGKPEKPLVKKSVKKSKSTDAKEIKCPYLENLATGKENNTEPLDQVWKYRETEMKNSIKISIEPDSPERPAKDSIDLSLYKIEDITVEKIQSVSGSQLKQILRFLCEEARSLSVISQKLPEMRSQLIEKIQQRRDLENQSQEDIEKIKEKWSQRFVDIQALQENRKEEKIALVEKQEQVRRKDAELDALKAHLGDLKRENILLKTQKLHYDDAVETRDHLQGLISAGLETKHSLEAKLSKSHNELSESQKTSNEDISSIKHDLEDLKSQIKHTDDRYKEASEENSKLKKSVSQLKSQLSDAQNLKNQVKQSIEAFKNESSKRDEVNQKLHLLTTDLEKESHDILHSQQQLMHEKKEMLGKLSELELQIDSKEAEILKLRKSFFEASANKLAQDQICCMRADLTELVEDLNKLHRLHEESRSYIMRDLEAGSKILVDESEKVFVQAEKLDHMIDAVDKKEEELDDLKNTMGEVRKKQCVHVPVKDDPVDVALAEYLNSKDTPVPIRFIRQDGGNYVFGSKKIYVKIESGRILVKVGGGFTSIEEFLNIYTPVEIEKQESSPKAAGKSSRESSPKMPAQRLSQVFEATSKSPRKT